MRNFSYFYLLIISCVLTSKIVEAQIITPPSGDNQKASVSQNIGLVTVTINYSSPNVHAPDGTDRTGHIWGELVPFGFTSLGFGLSNENNPSPWRAGANENTVITFSHDVFVEGKPLKAGSYGFFIAPSEADKKWLLIFSKNNSAWGSYFYNEAEDVLRVEVVPKNSDYHEWLTYEFTDRQADYCIAELFWENKSVPFKISVPDITQLYISEIRKQLQNSTGFQTQSWIDAANFCVQSKINLNEALEWAEYAMNENNGIGKRDFNSISCLANVYTSLGKTKQADSLMRIAIAHPSAGMMDIHFYARGLQAQGKAKEALEIYKINFKKYPDDAVTLLGLTRGYSATGDYKSALKYAESALALKPDGQLKLTLESAISKLKEGKDMN